MIASPLFAVTWYVRPDGGTRSSAKVPKGQCDGRTDAAYPGSGSNRHCAFKDFRYLWDDDSGEVGSGTWVIAGGDTVILRGCSANANQTNPSNPNCRIGWDVNWGGGPTNLWCQGIGNQNCFNPPIPAGTPTAHTRILGQCVVSGNCNTGNVTNRGNLSQIFGGMGVNYTLNLQSTRYVDIEGIELTSHNGVCTMQGGGNGPRTCNRNAPVDDYASSGFLLNKSSANITFQDVYVHGFNSSGFFGPIGGPIVMTRVASSFNGSAGWQFDDGFTTPDAPGSSIAASYVTMIGNGCYEEYPVKHSFSAHACYDDVGGGFGDAWSGQDTELDSFICDHCVMAYNTKDGFIGPHTEVKVLTITNSQSYGNMGAQWKWNNSPGSTTTFVNNLTVGNCARFQAAIPGAAQSFALASKLPGAYLSDFCRAGANTVAINSQQNSHVLFANNSFVNYAGTAVLLGCGPSKQNGNGMCGSTSFIFTNNIFLGYTLKGGEGPGLFYIDDRSIHIVSNHNIEYGNRSSNSDPCRGDILCADPRFTNEPPRDAGTNQTFLDNFNFLPQSSSPAIGHGTPINGVTVDFYGAPRPNPPTIGAVEPHR
jgi:hypothetical protein